MAFDQTWRVGTAWGVAITLLTVVGTYQAVRQGSTTPLGLGFLAWLAFMVWLERGVK